MALIAQLTGYVSRMLPQALQDTSQQLLRLSRYGDASVTSINRKQDALAEEGSYFVTNNAQTGIATPAVATFGATTPFITISNTDSPSNPNYKRIHLDYIDLTTTAAGGWASAGVNLQLMLYLDATDRYTSGGTDISANVVNPNMDAAARASVAKVRVGNITAAAATGAVRAVCGLRTLRPAVSTTVADVVGETKHLNFGGVEAMLNGSITVAAANMISVPLPPVILGPGQCCLIYYVLNGTTPSAASYAPEFGWWER